MRVSERYSLQRRQGTLDFVDVDTLGDARLFIDPQALRLLPSEWASDAVALIQDFFEEVLKCIKTGDHSRGQALLRQLSEPNETHLGFSRGRAKGRALGPYLAEQIWVVLAASEAAQSGLLTDLEDTILMIPKIGDDIISDITTNVIRESLIEYTQNVCAQYGIPMEEGVISGPLWDPDQKRWASTTVSLPLAEGGRLLLIPKSIVRLGMSVDAEDYYQHYLLPRMQDEHAARAFVSVLKDRRPARPSKKALREIYGPAKRANAELTPLRPEVLAQYKRDKKQMPQKPLSHSELGDALGVESPDYQALMRDVESSAPGRNGAHEYERSIEKLLSALGYPHLDHPEFQHRIDGGRKIVDITYLNIATDGFFRWVKEQHPGDAARVFVECKNYSVDVGNPELDQLSGRMGDGRGRFGMLVHRGVEDRARLIAVCRDRWNTKREIIIPLDDADLAELVSLVASGDERKQFRFWKGRYEALVL